MHYSSQQKEWKIIDLLWESKEIGKCESCKEVEKQDNESNFCFNIIVPSYFN